MSAPTPQDLLTLRFAQAGTPAAVVAVASVDTKTLAFAWRGAPVVISTSAAASSSQIRVVFVAM